MKSQEARISELLEAIRPLVAIADEYDNDGLDEVRPSWIAKGVSKYDPKAELYNGRGGKCLITLEDALKAREVATGKKYSRPTIDPITEACIKMYEASIPNISWDEMSEERRNDIISNYRKLGLLDRS